MRFTFYNFGALSNYLRVPRQHGRCCISLSSSSCYFFCIPTIVLDSEISVFSICVPFSYRCLPSPATTTYSEFKRFVVISKFIKIIVFYKLTNSHLILLKFQNIFGNASNIKESKFDVSIDRRSNSENKRRLGHIISLCIICYGKNV